VKGSSHDLILGAVPNFQRQNEEDQEKPQGVKSMFLTGFEMVTYEIPVKSITALPCLLDFCHFLEKFYFLQSLKAILSLSRAKI
jgi:hypothetical protein